MTINSPKGQSSTYYDKGSEEVATETALTVKRLEPRRKLTRNSKRLVIALVGLPGRGKSFVARKLQTFMTWTGTDCKIFNVGRYRREAAAQIAMASGHTNEREAAGACDAKFFDANNKEASIMRERVAELAMNDMLRWLDDDDDDSINGGDDSFRSTSSSSANGCAMTHDRDRIAIFDATNSTVKRRQWILEECTLPEKRPGKPTGVVFVESLCDDKELLEENFRFKVSNSPDFKGMSVEEGIADLRERVRKYEEQYETITDDSQSYIKIYNLSTKLLVNHIYGRMAKNIVPALMAWNIGTRPILICRPGMTPNGVLTDMEDYVTKVDADDMGFLDMSAHSRKKSSKGDSLGPIGLQFRDELQQFVARECVEFLTKREGMYSPNLHTGTSITGMASSELSFPIKVFTSTMPRALESVSWAKQSKRVEQLSNLNPLDKGDFAGMELEEIREVDPVWYSRLEQDPFCTRFPGGECYYDLVHRLESIIIDVEQQVTPVLIVSHISILQVLIAYLRNYPVEKCMSIEVPMHTVLKFIPSTGGGWSESIHPLLPAERDNYVPPVVSVSDMSILSSSDPPTTPIWGDHISRKRPSAFSS